MVNKSIVGTFQRDGKGEFSPKEFIKKYEQTYIESNNRSGFKTKKSFSPSTLGYGHGTCPRFWYLAFTGVEFEEELESRSIANMENGTLAHERIQKNIRNMDIMIADEVEIIQKDPPIRGFVDILVKWKGKRIPGEIKTANAASFTFRATTGKPSPSHLVQFLIYLVETGSDEGFLLYENKDTQEIHVIPVVMDDKNKEYVAYLYEWMRTTYGAFEAQTLPERPWKRKNAKICGQCPVRNACFNDYGDGEVNLLPLEVRKP